MVSPPNLEFKSTCIMKGTFKAIGLFIMFVLSVLPVAAEDWSYDFETAKSDIGKLFHEHREVKLNGMIWKIYCVRNNDDRMDYANGNGSMRIYGTKASMDGMPYVEMKSNKEGGIGVVTFDYRAYEREQETQTSWIVQITEDDGAHWQTIGKPFTPTMEKQTFLAKANKANARIRIVREDYEVFQWKDLGFKAIFNIDDMSVTDASAVDPNAPSIDMESNTLSFGEVYKGESKAVTCKLSYKNLTSPIKITMDDNSPFTLSKTEIAVKDGENEDSFSINFAPTGYGTYKGTVTLRSGDVETFILLSGVGLRKPGCYEYSGGKGTAEEPYLISTATDIAELSEAVNDKYTYEGKYFRMTTDIDLSEIGNLTPIGNNFGSAGSVIKAFCGTFDGDGYTLTNLHMSFQGNDKIGVALFGVIQGATIRNLHIDNSSIQSDALTAGFVAAAMGGTVSNCHLGENVTINSTYQAYAAGIVCGVFGYPIQISDCSSQASISAVGMGVAGILASCGVDGNVVKRCVNYGELSSNSGIVGGIVGQVEDGGSVSVMDCANFGTITSPTSAGGIAALLSPSSFGPLDISNCYNNGYLDCFDNVHPITLPVTGEMSAIHIVNSYYCSDKYTDEAQSAIGKTTQEMKSDAFMKLLNNGRKGPWVRSDAAGGGYPLPSDTVSSDVVVGNCLLIADDVTVPQYAYYTMFIKKYNDKLTDYVGAGNRFVVKYQSDNEDVVASWGNSFKTVAPGEANVTMRISGSADGSLNAFDENNILDEVSFRVKVVEQSDIQLPPVNISWGASKSEAMGFEASAGHERFTENYWKMHPSVSEEAQEGVEVFLTDNFEFPLSMLYFNSREELIATDLIVASWERVKTPIVSAICKLLKDKGFKDMGLDPETGQWLMYNQDIQTMATCGLVFVQNQSYYYLSLYYEPEAEGIEKICLEKDFPKISVNCHDSKIGITANEHVGQQITIFGINGSCLAQSVVRHGENVFDIASKEPLVIKIGNCASVKVLR